jgi:hypothetical protein
MSTTVIIGMSLIPDRPVGVRGEGGLMPVTKPEFALPAPAAS